MTTYTEWRVTGTPRRQPTTVVFSSSDYNDPETMARAFMANTTEAVGTGWADGPHLHTRTVTVTDWETA
jgi:hypothetical protein